MTTQDKPSIVLTTIFTWSQWPRKDVTAPLLEVTLRRAGDAESEACVEEIHIEPPRTWKPGNVFIGHDAQKLAELKPGSTLINDSRSTPWEVSQRITRDTWSIILCNTKPGDSLPEDWALTIAIVLEKPGADASGELWVDVDGLRQNAPITIATEPSPPPWIVRLETDPAETNALVRGQEVVLRWEVENIQGDAELRGSLPGANTIRIANGDKGHRSTRALDESVYTLTATVMHEGKLVEVVRRVHVNLEAPQYGLNIEFVPTAVFPGGPVVCYFSAYNVNKIAFNRSGDEPNIDTNVDGDKARIVKYGPKEGRTWTLSAVYSTPRGDRTAQGNPIKAIAPSVVEDSYFFNLPVVFGDMDQHRAVYGMAAGTFVVQSEGPNPRLAKRDWIAVATDMGLQLWARDANVGETKVAPEIQSRNWENDWLEEALAGEFWGVGAATESNIPDTQCIVAVRTSARDCKVAEVIEIDMPLREMNPYRKALVISEARFVGGPVRVVPVANRVFLFGRGTSCSYERNLNITTCRDEPRLGMVAFPEWEVVGITAERRANDANDSPTGYLYALEKKSGILLRFDIRDGIVLAPRMAARGNDKVAPLEKLQRAQACLSPNPPPFPRADLVEGRGYTGIDIDGSILEYLNPITETSSMVALGGALLVRSDVVDLTAGRTIQDRAYDPRLDVWARCGHPFAQANREADNHFASTDKTLYCLAGESLLYVEGPLPSYLGFMSSDFTPIDARALAPLPWPESFTWPTIVNKTSLNVQWPNGRLDSEMFERGRLKLALTSSGVTVIVIDGEINRETGEILTIDAHVDTTGRKVALCRWDAHTLTIEPMVSKLQINTPAGLVLPFSYYVSGPHLSPSIGESATGTAIEIATITGETRCTIEFKYQAGDARAGELDARANLLIVNGKVAELQWEGKHSAIFNTKIVDGHIVELSLVNATKSRE